MASALPNVRAPTLGGRQMWGDRVLRHGWRIQRHVLSGHHRLLDERDVRQAWGTLAACRRVLDRKTEHLGPMPSRVVLVLHGLFRSRASMASMCRFLDTRGHHALAVGYPAVFGSLAAHAEVLDALVGELDGVQEIDVVAHSLGNLVVRRLLADDPAPGRTRPRLRRMVMLGPPNQGAVLARRLLPLDVGGPARRWASHELAHRWEEVDGRLAVPDCEFGILAGAIGPRGANPLVPGADDGVVSVDSTHLEGAADFRVLPVWHGFQTTNRHLQALTDRFLRTGRFGSERRRQRL